MRLAPDHRTVQAEKLADRLKTHSFLILKTSQMFTREYDLISPAGGVPEIYIGQKCVQLLFLDSAPTGSRMRIGRQLVLGPR
jgi:hypothetical protein